MRKLKAKVCIMCGDIYQPTGSCSKRCVFCADKHHKEYHRKYMYKRKVESGEIKNPGVGSGGTTGKGPDNHMWKDGLGALKTHGIHRIKAERRYCEVCDKDLKDATHYFWCVHHIDHDTSHNDDNNLMLLCKSCHQAYHMVHKAFEGATTIQEWSRVQENSKRPAPNKCCDNRSNRIHYDGMWECTNCGSVLG